MVSWTGVGDVGGVDRFTNLFVNLSEPGVHFQAGLSDCKAIIGETAELECKVSSEECAGLWYKDGAEVSARIS